MIERLTKVATIAALGLAIPLHLFVDPDHRAQGLGRRLLGVGEEMLRSGGYRDIELNTMVGNTRALELYGMAGWTMTVVAWLVRRSNRARIP